MIDTLKNNILVAEFMGIKECAPEYGMRWWQIDKSPGGKNSYSLKYDESWDWLIPVVEKIESMGCIVEISLSVGKMCRIRKIQSKIKDWHTMHESNSTIEAVYKSVVEFIKWHNESNYDVRI